MRRLTPLLIAAALLLAALGLRWPFLDREIWNIDEGGTFTMAQQVLDGAVLYRDAADHRSPLVPYLKAAILAVAGDWNTRAVHIVLALLMGGIAVALWQIGRRLGDHLSGLLAAAIFTFLSITLLDFADAISAHTGWFLAAFSAFGFATFVAALDRPTALRGFIFGALFGFSFLCKQPGLLDYLVVWVLLALLILQDRTRAPALIRVWLGSAVGALLPVVAYAIYFIAHGAWHEAIYYAFTYNTEIYIGGSPLLERLSGMRAPFDLARANAPVVLLLVLAAAVALFSRAARDVLRRPFHPQLLVWLILGWCASGLISTGLSGRTFSHYSTQLVAPLSLACGWILSRLIATCRARRPAALSWIACALTAFALGTLVFSYTRRARVLAEPDTFPLEIASRIRAHTAPEGRIFVWGYYSELYALSQRLPASRFIYTNFVTGLVPWTNLDPLIDTTAAIVPDAPQQLLADLHRTPPELILDTAGGRGYTKFPLHDQTALWDLIQRDFAQVAATHGMRLFKRLSPLSEPATLDGSTPDPNILIGGFHELRRNEPPRVQVTAPAGASRIELFAGEHLLARLDHSTAEEVQALFFVDPKLPESKSIRAVVTYPGTRAASAPFDFRHFAHSAATRSIDGPQLAINRISLPPSAVDLTFDGLSPTTEQPDTWRVDAPETLEYSCPANLRSISFVHGPFFGSRGLSDGYDLLVDLVDAAGHRTELHRHRMQTRTVAADQVPQHVTLPLPPDHPGGRLIFRFLPGPYCDPNYDWIYFGQLRAETHGPAIRAGDAWLFPRSGLAANEPTKPNLSGQWLAHAPTRFEWTRPPHVSALTLHYGIEEGAYTSPDGHTDGVTFILELIDEQQQVHPLFTRTLTPFNHPEHRGEQISRIELPPKLSGTLVLRTDAGPNQDASWDWAWIGALHAEGYGPPIVISPDRELLPISSYTVDPAGDPSKRNGPADWGAHADAQLVYDRPVDLTRVTFRYGLADGAARDESGQQRSDGAEMIVVFEPSSGAAPVELFRRALDPFNNPSDLGEQSSTIDLPPIESGRLVFRLSPGPHNNNAFDWGFWGPFEGQSLRHDNRPTADASPSPASAP